MSYTFSRFSRSELDVLLKGTWADLSTLNVTTETRNSHADNTSLRDQQTTAKQSTSVTYMRQEAKTDDLDDLSKL